MKSMNTTSEEMFRFFVRRIPEKHTTNNVTHIMINPQVGTLADSLAKVIDESKKNRERVTNMILQLEDSIIGNFVHDKVSDLQINDHNNLIREIESDKNRKLEKIASIINEFTHSDEFILDFEKLNLKKLETFVRWLISSDKNLELDIYKNKINEIFSKSAQNLASSKQFRQDKSNVYNSILSLGFIENPEPVLKDNLFILAKVINFVELIGHDDGSLTSGNGIPNPLDTEIVIPSNIFDENISTKQYHQFTDFIIENSNIKNLALKLRDLKIASKELTQIGSSQLRLVNLKNRSTDTKIQQSNNSQPSNAQRKDEDEGLILGDDDEVSLVIAEEAIKRLSDTTKKVLQDEHVPLEKISVNTITPTLGKKIRELNLILYPKIGKNIFKNPEFIIKSVNDAVLDKKNFISPANLPINHGLSLTDIAGTQNYPSFVSGIGDLKKVKDRIVKYAYGEIAHVENVLMGELKDRTHRKLNRTEETITTEEKTTEDITNYLESTERFELQKTTNEVIETENKLDFGFKITAGYGPFFEASAYLDVGMGTSTTESIELSSTYAKNVISKSISKIQRIIMEKRIKKIIQEIEETNVHKLDNTGKENNIHGIYQWLDKIYCGELYVYDKRLLLEFVIPEPAKFYKKTFVQSKEKAIALKNGNKVLPPEPEPFFKDEDEKDPIMPDDIKEDEEGGGGDYILYASWYDAEVTAPPPRVIWKTSTIKQDQFVQSEDVKTESVSDYVAERLVPLPEGYQYNGTYYYYLSSGGPDKSIRIRIAPPQNQEKSREGEVGIIVSAQDVRAFTVVVAMGLLRTDRLYRKWQLDTWTKIHEAYLSKKSLYDSKMAEIAISEGIEIVGSNPLFNRETEKVELKKNATMILTENPIATSGAYYNNVVGDYKYPYLDFKIAKFLGKQIQFFEQAIEWHNMLYVFYSYFWGVHKEWVENLFRNDVDPLFNNFLKAGAARVVVPVRPGFEKAILFFLKTKHIWEGKDVPLIGEPMYLDIVEEMKEKLDLSNYDGILQDNWEYKVPTSLVYLRNNDLSDSEENLPGWEACQD